MVPQVSNKHQEPFTQPMTPSHPRWLESICSLQFGCI